MQFAKAILAGVLGLATIQAAHADEPLPALSLEPEVTVSGLSSGAFMTVQLQTAFSTAISGVGVVAGGPYDCADGYVYNPFFYNPLLFNPFLNRKDVRVSQAVLNCLNPTESLPVLPLSPYVAGVIERTSAARIRTLEAAGAIDPASGIADDRIYMFLGTRDPIVRSETMGVLRGMYTSLGVPDAQIQYVEDVPAGHSFVTELGDVPCSQTEPDYLNLCDVDGEAGAPPIDQAQDILTHLYGPLSPQVAPVDANLVTFDQSAYSDDAMGMDPKAFVYIPADCRTGTCRLHIALHGCSQGRSWQLADGSLMGDRYATLTGYNGWAERNRIVVLYPQAIAVPAPALMPARNNPKGCWDWWGYGGSDYLSKNAPQMAAIARMAAALGAPID